MKEWKMDTLTGRFWDSVNRFADRPSLSFVGEKSESYAQLGHSVGKLSKALQLKGIKKGDKVGILGYNMSNWGKAYFAIVNLGAVAVPMLPDFHSGEIQNIIQHSECKAIFVSEALNYRLKEIDASSLEHTFLLETFQDIRQKTVSLLDAVTDDISGELGDISPDDLASIIYTSGTTGKSKGVMLTHRNLACNAQAGMDIQPIGPSDRFLSILPLSHAYEFTMGLLISLFTGASTYYLQKPPTPAILLPALKEVKPTIMLSVPLIIEKIYRNKIVPAFMSKKIVAFLYKHTPLRILLNRAAGKKLKETFGGELIFFGIGGAKLDGQVEKFLREAKFPYAIGYGLTETSPLLAGANPQNTCFQGTGPTVSGMEIKIDNPDPVTGEGEILARG